MSKYRHKKSYRTLKKKHPLRFLKSKIFWILFLILIILGSLIYIFIFSELFKIKNVEISGNEKCPYAEISKIVSSNLGSIFLYKSEEVNKELKEKYPEINQVKIERKLPDSLIVKIKEREPVAFICKPSLRSEIKIFGEKSEIDCFYIDKEGIVFEEKTENSLNLPVIIFNSSGFSFVLGREIIDQDYLKKILEINSNLKNLAISKFYPVSKNKIKVQTKENWVAYFDPEEDVDWQVEKLNILLKEKFPLKERGNLEYIDLRFEKIYTKRLENPSEE